MPGGWGASSGFAAGAGSGGGVGAQPSAFVRLLVVRLLREEALVAAAQGYVATRLGKAFTGAPLPALGART
jgi:hypothetical protein